jgi:hypothetical protein
MATSPTGSDLQNFLLSTLKDPHQLIMAFCNEPEVTAHHGPNGCMCDLTGTVTPCDGSANIIKQFEVESDYIRKFELAHNATNVKVAEISGGSYYAASASGCSVDPTSNPKNFLVPYQYVDFYLVDMYEGRGGHPISSAEPLNQDSSWNNWVACTHAPGVARGISEFGINCGGRTRVPGRWSVRAGCGQEHQRR